MKKYILVLVAAYIGLTATTANATAILCTSTLVNHMYMDDTQASACVDSGSGNINGNVMTDDFLTSGGTALGYVGVEGGTSFTQSDGTGTWSITDGLGIDALGFKFGTGNQPDEWFIFDLVDGVLSGDWEFVNVFEKGGGLSHLQAYTTGGDVPEPGILALLAVGLVGMAVARRRTKV